MLPSSQDRQDDPTGFDMPPDFVLLLTPDHQVRERLQGEQFIAFFGSVMRVITEYCIQESATLVELQVGCAILPGNRLVVEVQTVPAELWSQPAKEITTRLRQLEVPDVEDGTIVFSRRIRFTQQGEAILRSIPFASYLNREQSITFDELLLKAGQVDVTAPSWWGKTKALFAGRRRNPPQVYDKEGVAATLAQRTGMAVLACNGELRLSGPKQEPFTVIEDKTESEGFAIVENANGGNGTVDRMTLDYLRSQAPQPTQAAFNNLLARLSRVRVLEGGMAYGRPLTNTVLLDISMESDLEELKRALEILDGPAGHCYCCGEPTLEFLSSQNESIAVIGLHHGHSVRWEAWKDDAELLDGRRLLNWLAQRGVPGPLDKFLDGLRKDEQSRAAWQRWQSAMPDCLKQLTAEVWQRIQETNDLTPVRESLRTAYPDLSAQILSLFRWFGTGAGPWTGFPVYERLAEEILLQYPVEELVEALQNASLSEEELEGASRFFAGWAFVHRTAKHEVQLPPTLTYTQLGVFLPDRSDEPVSIPVTLKQQFLAHCRGSSDEDKKQRAESAFAE
ncbi:MAG: hypothetical protein ACK5OB_10380 [Pirellula sp.]